MQALARPRDWQFVTMCLFVAAVSVYDAYLVVKCKSVILHTEQNPICRYLISLDVKNMSVFLPAKFCGTSLVILFLMTLYRTRRQMWFPVTAGLASFQLWLLFYLTLF